jgi:hypothetical protein
VEIHRAFRGDQLQDVKREFCQTLFEVESGVVDFRERLTRFPAKRLDVIRPTPPTEFVLTLRQANVAAERLA